MPATERYVALLRGINVGRAKRVAMSELRAAVESVGFRDVRTLLNSGNVVLGGGRIGPEVVARRIEQAVVDRVGVSARVTVLTASELESVIAENPFRELATDPTRYLVAFLRAPERARSALAPLASERWAPEAMAVGPRAAYLWCADGLHDSRLAAAVGRLLGDEMTTRNWSTVTKLLAIV
jgi:uncharacterized protein (DUF1697 family)